ncbi:hypothetical protein MVES_001810 [Malassezia vespertilionis]|uniref:Mtf2-like C-terminal domain-containing protein n=1 Tax=Malassezia vespertilionis TaxID=2020962 RepID=A0A2N1JD34_9BASI|nr:hypothetical protein MVES_001810 [Malassezia vespertilionis]
MLWRRALRVPRSVSTHSTAALDGRIFRSFCRSCTACLPEHDPNPWDELFAGPDAYPTTTPAIRSVPSTAHVKMPRSVLYAEERNRNSNTAPLKHDTSALTKSEAQQFRRIFALLETEMGNDMTQAPPPEPLHAFAEHNKLHRSKLTTRGGGVGTRFEAAKEGLAASLSPESMELGVDEVWVGLQSQPTLGDVWRWAVEHVWGTNAAYGVRTAFFAPALHMLLLTLRDKFHAPHAALSVTSTTRALGPEAYVLGCTASLYAEAARTAWLCLRDPYKVLAIAREARQTGVLSGALDAHTRTEDAVLRDYLERVRNELRTHALQRAQAQREPRDPSTPLVLDALHRDFLRVVKELRSCTPEAPAAPSAAKRRAAQAHGDAS